MKTVIVPVDFSETSLNAARYAVQLLTGHYGVNMILLSVYDKPSQAAEIQAKLENLKEELSKTGIVKMTLLAEESDDFIKLLDQLARHQQADMIIMGITGRSSLGQAIIGSNTLTILEKKVCPIMIIPPEAKFREIKNAMLTSEFINAAVVTPSVPIKKVLQAFEPHLHIINVNSEHYVAITEEYQAEKESLKKMFAEFEPEFYFLGLYDVDEAINQFAKDKNIDLIITVRHEQNLIDKLFKTSHIKNLAYQSTIPILAVHE